MDVASNFTGNIPAVVDELFLVDRRKCGIDMWNHDVGALGPLYQRQIRKLDALIRSCRWEAYVEPAKNSLTFAERKKPTACEYLRSQWKRKNLVLVV